ncbi:hypothetical protein EW145_g1650 [Phellinidium pouzarii]|uniref:Cyanovirin-N domain-containing protein n=1 Tax=Phellinidium pouzarii TaxID=167371 RepID=A0A4S4LDM4_9AGAM|nr:hypothetical protein EW145_g1650 [Phellinidium pouzarii]
MKPFITSLLVLSALSSGVLGANLHVRAPPFSGKDKCPSAEVVSSSNFTVNGHVIQRQTFSCPDGSLTKREPVSSSSRMIRSNPLEKRNAAECRTPAPECQCGQSFVCECQDVTAEAPVPGDCTILIDSTQVLAQTEGSTFIVQPDNFELITFQTCALEFTNQGSSALEYCWDEIGSTGGLVNQVCFEAAAGTAAACNADDGLWLVQSLRVGS